MVVGGAPPPTSTIERLETELGWELIQIYGLTETSPLLTVNRRRAEWAALTAVQRARRLNRAGAPAIGVKIRVDEEGEVLARGNVVFAGYWQQPDATAEAMAGGWFHTGDGGRLDSEGYLTISDRKKDVIITGGENVSSIEVEDALYQHPAVAEAAVFGIPDLKWGETVKALVVLEGRRDRDRGRPRRALPNSSRALQVPHVHRARRGDRSYRDGQGAEVQAAGSLLGGPDATRQLSRSVAPCPTTHSLTSVSMRCESPWITSTDSSHRWTTRSSKRRRTPLTGASRTCCRTSARPP